MKIALYGMPCAGKSTLMDRITDAKIINGSQELRCICGGSFSELSEEEKHQVRIKYTEYINALNDEVIVSDGHYSFMGKYAEQLSFFRSYLTVLVEMGIPVSCIRTLYCKYQLVW